MKLWSPEELSVAKRFEYELGQLDQDTCWSLKELRFVAEALTEAFTERCPDADQRGPLTLVSSDTDLESLDWPEPPLFSTQNAMQVLRRSLIIAAHGKLERRLEELCRLAQWRIRSSLALADISSSSGGYLGQVRCYLNKVVGIELPEAEWALASAYSVIRNNFAHDRGEVVAVSAKAHQKVYRLLEPRGVRLRKTLPDSKNQSLELDATAVPLCIDAVESCLGVTMGALTRLGPAARGLD